METQKFRKVCMHCNQELSRSAYSRHQLDRTGKICPGKNVINESYRDRSPTASDLDSTFDFGSEVDENDDLEPSFSPDSEKTQDEMEVLSSDVDSDDTVSSDGEVWEDTDSSEGHDDNDSGGLVNEVVFGISFFLTYYHLLYRLSENAIGCLLKFTKLLLNFLALATGLKMLFGIVKALPSSIHTVRNKFKKNNFVEYVVCMKCNKLYLVHDCIVNHHGTEESRHCDFVEFPSHPILLKRVPCGELLLKKIKIGKKIKLVPRKTFMYHSVIDSVKALAMKKDFLEKCDRWRSRSKQFSQHQMGDIFDGQLWKDFMHIDGIPFLATPNNLCLSINVDWFRVYKHSQYSAGPIYLAVLNLPRNERYKVENIILAGIIPGPKEPKLNINTFLAPLVKDMEKLYDGITFKNSASVSGMTTLRCIISCVACDLPATRKVCGFANFNGKYGCSKCMKQFMSSTFGNKPSYGGYNFDNWQLRDLNTHKQFANRYLMANSIIERKKITNESGIKYSQLLNLPNFDVVRCHIVDPMHNIFLGLAKHVIQTWKDIGILKVSHFVKLQDKIDLINPPLRMGRIPRKIESGFAAFTADEWKNFILIYSIFALRDIVSIPHYQCWSLLVTACGLLYRPVLSRNNVDEAHILLMEFCKLFETLYGEEYCTPNMHMSLHLKSCILDYGPLPAFWCFAFERYNGILEGVRKSWLSPERQMLIKFTGMQKCLSLSNTLGDKNEFMRLICEHMNTETKSDTGSLSQYLVDDSITIEKLKNISCKVQEINAQKQPNQKFSPPYKEKYFSNVHMSYLKEMYDLLYPLNDCEVSRYYREYKSIVVNGRELISCLSRSQRSAVIAAKWPGVIGIDSSGEAPLRVGLVTSFIESTITFLSSDSSANLSKTHALVRVQWYGDHLQRDYMDSSIIIASTVFDNESCASFMPVNRIFSVCASSSPFSFKFDYGEDSIMIAVPLCMDH